MKERKNWNFKKSIYEKVKRILDIIFSLLAILLTLPIMLVIAIAIKLESDGPVIFKQLRTGKYGKEFNVYKFRTMEKTNDVREYTTQDKQTRVGKILRKTSLDELPQFFCILIGKMSFIGPRPWIVDYYNNMTEKQKHRVDVTPGLTGLAQINGRNNLTIFEKINYDLEYIDNYSLYQDIKILFLTIKIVLTKTGVEAGKITIHKELEMLKKQNSEVQA